MKRDTIKLNPPTLPASEPSIREESPTDDVTEQALAHRGALPLRQRGGSADAYYV